MSLQGSRRRPARKGITRRTTRQLLVQLVFLVGLMAACCAPDREARQEDEEPSPDTELADAREQLDADRFEDAGDALERAREAGAPDYKTDEVDADLNRRRAEEAVDDGDFDVAFERFQRASGLEPNHERRFEDLLEAVKAGQEAGMPPEKLAEVATRATELEANSREAQALAARLWDDAGRPNKALPHYQWLYKVDPEDDKVGARLGTLLLSEGRTGQARDVLEEVHKRAPERAVTGMKLAEALEKLGEDERAEEVYETLLEEHPDRVGVLLRYARFLAAHGKRERARELQEKAGEVQPATEEREMRELR